MAAALCDLAEFTSAEFRPFLRDEDQVNPGVYGAELAFWLASELAKREVFTTYPNSEDWGWYIEYITPDGAEFAVHCGNMREVPDRWGLHLRRHGRKIFGRDKPPFSLAAPLIDAIHDTLKSHPGISDLEWMYRPSEQ